MAEAPASSLAWQTDHIRVDGADAYLQLVSEQTTGGHVWDASRQLLEYLERSQSHLFAGMPKAVLELGSGTGWLGMALASNAAAQLTRVHLTEMENGNALGWLRHNVDRNRDDLRGAPLTVGACNWSWWAQDSPTKHVIERDELEAVSWDLILGADLVYNDHGVFMLPHVLRALCGPNTVILYSHTMLRFEHYDDMFFANVLEAGLRYEQVFPPLEVEGGNDACSAGGDLETPFTDLFPDMHIVVFKISRPQTG